MQVNLKQGSAEWLEFRKKHIGASDAPIIMGVSPWTNVYNLWKEKVGYGEPIKKTPAMERGIRLEESARIRFMEMTDIEVSAAVFVSEKYPWMIASLDGINKESTEAVEIKISGPKDHQTAKDGIIPEKYYPQLQHQMEVKGLDHIWYFSAEVENHNGEEVVTGGVILKCEYNRVYVDILIQQEKKFYDCMMQRIPPDCRESKIIHMEDEEWLNTIHYYNECKVKKDWWEMETQRMKEKLLELSGGLEAQGMGFKLSRVSRKGTIDWESVCREYNISEKDYEKFRKTSSEYWNITKCN